MRMKERRTELTRFAIGWAAGRRRLYNEIQRSEAQGNEHRSGRTHRAGTTTVPAQRCRWQRFCASAVDLKFLHYILEFV